MRFKLKTKILSITLSLIMTLSIVSPAFMTVVNAEIDVNSLFLDAELKALKKGDKAKLQCLAFNKPDAFGDNGVYIINNMGFLKGYLYIKDTTKIKTEYDNIGKYIDEGTVLVVEGIVVETEGQLKIEATEINIINHKYDMKPSQETVSEFSQNINNYTKVCSAIINSISADINQNIIIELEQDGKKFTAKLNSKSRNNYIEGQYSSGMVVDVTGFIVDDKTIKIRNIKDVTISGNNLSCIELDNVKLRNLNGNTVSEVSENEMIEASITLENHMNIGEYFDGILIFKLKKDGKIYRTGICDRIIADNQEVSFGFDTVNMPKGKYILTVYYWDSILQKTMLADATTLDFIIE